MRRTFFASRELLLVAPPVGGEVEAGQGFSFAMILGFAAAKLPAARIVPAPAFFRNRLVTAAAERRDRRAVPACCIPFWSSSAETANQFQSTP